jgi:hypothetical protein
MTTEITEAMETGSENRNTIAIQLKNIFATK